MATRESEQIQRINAAVSDQAGLIQQISAALEGKAAGGGSGGESGGDILPAGITAIDSGKITITQTPTSGFVVEHDMGVVPNFVAMVVVDPLTAAKPGLLMAYYNIAKQHTRGTTNGTFTYAGHYVRTYYKDDGSVTTGSSSTDTAVGDNTCWQIVSTNVFQNMLPGYTYRWVCARIEGIA